MPPGYRGWRWYAAGAVFGLLFIPIAAERADRTVTVVDADHAPAPATPSCRSCSPALPIAAHHGCAADGHRAALTDRPG